VDDLDALAMAVRKAVPGEQQHEASRRVGVEERVAAAVFDVIIFGFAWGVLLIVTNQACILAAISERLQFSMVYDDRVLMAVTGIAWLTYTAAEVFLDGTLGKLALGLRIRSVRLSPSTRRQRLIRWALRRSPEALWCLMAGLSTMQYLLRQWVPVSNGLLRGLATATMIALSALVVSFAFVMTKEKRSLYDRVAGTAVIHDIDVKPSNASAFAVLVRRPKEEPLLKGDPK
jgi:uncharacterized RDD family membrane protein YckC